MIVLLTRCLRVDSLKARVKDLHADDLLPNSIFLPHSGTISIRNPLKVHTPLPSSVPMDQVTTLTVFRSNPLAVLVKVGEAKGRAPVPADVRDRRAAEKAAKIASRGDTNGDEEDTDDEMEESGEDEGEFGEEDEETGADDDGEDKVHYVLHINFGNEQLESMVRTPFKVSASLVPVINATLQIISSYTIPGSLASAPAASTTSSSSAPSPYHIPPAFSTTFTAQQVIGKLTAALQHLLFCVVRITVVASVNLCSRVVLLPLPSVFRIVFCR